MKNVISQTRKKFRIYEVADGSVTFDHVTFRYNKTSDKPILDDINLTIHSGETIGVIGGTGSSKSSLVNLISRLYDVSSGSVKVGGVDVRDYHMDSLRNQVAVVLQKNVLLFRYHSGESALGEIKRLRRKSAAERVSFPVRMTSLRKCRTNTILILSRAEPMFPAVRNSVCVSPELFLRNPKY